MGGEGRGWAKGGPVSGRGLNPCVRLFELRRLREKHRLSQLGLSWARAGRSCSSEAGLAELGDRALRPEGTPDQAQARPSEG